MKIYLKEWKEIPSDNHDYETVSAYTNLEELRVAIQKAGYKRLTEIEANEIYERTNHWWKERIRVREMEVR